MRAVIQRVTRASVDVEGRQHASIGHGLLVLLGVETDDTAEDISWLAGKISKLRIFDDAQGVMNVSVQDVMGEVMVISQFTLHASTKKGNRPSYIQAAAPDRAEPLYEAFMHVLMTQVGCRVASGVFGAMMQVTLTNDGPVTIIIDTKIKW